MLVLHSIQSWTSQCEQHVLAACCWYHIRSVNTKWSPRYDEDAALTFGKAVSGMFAHAKGKSIGVIEGKEKDPEVLTHHLVALTARRQR